MPSHQSRVRYKVYTKAAYSDPEWTHEPRLIAVRVIQSLKPSLDQAELSWAAGDVATGADAEFGIQQFRSLASHAFVKITLLNDEDEERTLFVGHVPTQTADVRRRFTDALDPGGDQIITAVGLETFLDETAITRGYAADIAVDYSTTTAGEGWIKPIGHAPTFNRAYQFGPRQTAGDRIRGGNCSPDRAPVAPPDPPPDPVPDTPADYPRAVHCFYGGDSAQRWSAYKIAEYLIGALAPQWIPWRMFPPRAATSGGSEPTPAELLFTMLENDYIPAELAVEGRTIKAVLDELFDHRLGLSWRLNHKTEEIDEETTEFVELEILSLAPTSIEADGELLLPESSYLTQLTVGEESSLSSLEITEDTATKYGTVEIVGDRLLVCATLAVYNPDGDPPDESAALEPAWTSGDAAAYLTAAGTDDPEENDQVRESDRFRATYTTFRVRREWNRYTSTDGASRIVIPELLPDGTIDTTAEEPAWCRLYGATFESFTPIKAPKGTNFDAEFLPPSVFLPVPEEDRWVIADGMAAAGCRVRVTDAELAIEVTGRANHVIALGTFDPDATETLVDPQFDYRQMLVTVAFRTDQAVRVTRELPGGDPNRVLVIQMPECELHYAVPGTVIGTDDAGALVRYDPETPGEALRDDTTLMRRRAALIAAWHGFQRRAITAKFFGLDDSITAGDVIQSLIESNGTTSGLTLVNTPISSVQIYPEEQATIVTTDFIDFDGA